MSVYKRGKSWTAHMNWTDHTNKRRQKTQGGFRTKREAENFHRDFLASVAAGTRIASPNITLEDYLLGRWLPSHTKNVRPSTVESYRTVINAYVIPHLGHMKLDEIRTIHLESTYNQLLDNGRKSHNSSLSPKTIINVASIVKRALRDAVRWELLAQNPADSVQLPRRHRKEIQTLTPTDLGRYLASIQEHRLCAVLQLTCLTGMRRGEILGLRWSDIDFEAGTITIRRSRHRVGAREVIAAPKTDKARRTIHIDSDTLAKLRTWKSKQAEERLAAGEAWKNHDGCVVTNLDGSAPSITAFYRAYKKTIEASGVPDVNFHALRHSYVTAALLDGNDLKTVSSRVGHSETSVTANIYYHLVGGQDQIVADAIAESILSKSRKHG